MNQKNVFGMAAILLAVQMFVGVSIACSGSDCNMLNFYNQVNATGNVQVYQSGVKDVSFTNNIEVTNGALDFGQYVQSGEWAFSNEAYLEGTRVTFQGVTVGSEDCANCSCGEIKFNQHIEVDGFLDPWAHQKIENLNHEGIVLEQGVDVLPGGWMRINQSGYACGDEVIKGFLAQDGWLHSPMGGNNIAWQAGSIDGNLGYNKVEAEWWLDFNQVVSFNMD